MLPDIVLCIAEINETLLPHVWVALIDSFLLPQAYSSNAYLMEQVGISVDVGGVIHYCQEERGMTSFYVASENNPLVEQMLLQKYQNTDDYLQKMSTWITLSSLPNHFRSPDKFHKKVKSYRTAFMSKNYFITDIIGAYSTEISIFIDWITGQLCSRKPVTYWLDLVAYRLLILSKEEAGVERALGASYFATGNNLISKPVNPYN